VVHNVSLEMVLTFCCSVEKEELSAARDIAEFEKNKPLLKPVNRLDAMNVSYVFFILTNFFQNYGIGKLLKDRDFGLRIDKELGLSRKSGTLAVVGQGKSRHKAMHSSTAPSRPLSRTSRAESMGSLVDYSRHGGDYGSNMVTIECYQESHSRQQQVEF
jgi:hypothetical protein